MKFKKKVFIYKNKNVVALTKAHSKEEAVFKFERVFTNKYESITGDMVTEAKYDFCDIEVVNLD